MKKAPGAITKSNVLGNASGSTATLKSVPEPINSRTRPITVRAIVKPSPIPIPSKNESTGEFLEANASALPRMIQLTTISGI